MTEALPLGWAATTIGAVATVNPSSTSVSVPDDQLVTFLPMAAVKELSDELDLSTRRPFGAVKKGFTRFRDGDVLFAKITPSMENGKLAVAADLEAGIGCGTTEFHVIRPEAGISPHYLRYFMVRSAYRQEAKRNMQGAVGQQRVPADFVRDSDLPLAPAEEQKRIVSKIDELFSRIDEGERALARVSKLAERYRQSVLNAAVTGELTRDWREVGKAAGQPIESGEALLTRILTARREAWEQAELAKMQTKGITPKDDAWMNKYKEPTPPDTSELFELPEGWVWTSLGQLFEVSVGSTPSRKKSSYWGGGIPWVSSGEVAFCRISKTKETISQLGYDHSSVKLHPKGTVMLAMIGEGKTRGQAAILDIEACHNQNAASIGVSATPIPPEYIYNYLRYRYEIVRGIGQGGNQPALNSNLVKGIAIPLPPLEEIVEICEVVERQFAIVAAFSADVSAQHRLVDAKRQAILRGAFNGTLVAQDPSDEPASVVLERIASSRGEAKTASSKRTRKKKSA